MHHHTGSTTNKEIIDEFFKSILKDYNDEIIGISQQYKALKQADQKNIERLLFKHKRLLMITYMYEICFKPNSIKPEIFNSLKTVFSKILLSIDEKNIRDVFEQNKNDIDLLSTYSLQGRYEDIFNEKRIHDSSSFFCAEDEKKTIKGTDDELKTLVLEILNNSYSAIIFMKVNPLNVLLMLTFPDIAALLNRHFDYIYSTDDYKNQSLNDKVEKFLTNFKGRYPNISFNTLMKDQDASSAIKNPAAEFYLLCPQNSIPSTTQPSFGKKC